MGNQVDMAAKRLFDNDALAATNIKFYPGFTRDADQEAIARELNHSLARIEAGDFEEADID